MALFSTFLTVSSSVLLTPFLTFLLSIVFLASIGKSLGVRRLYVKLLLQVFEYGRQHIEIAQKDRLGNDAVEETEEKDDESNMKNSQSNKVTKGERASNGVSHVISREDLILVPDAVQNYTNGNSNGNSNGSNTDEANLEVSHGLPRRPSFETFKREYQLADCFDYIKAGVEAIIEDEVTHRFEAEELKSWNLLTRTNLQYEFISWRLTVIWVVGFLVRYFFLLPLRIIICFVGVVWMVLTTFLLSFYPAGRFKRYLYKRTYLTCFRILARSLSVVMTVHNKHYRPEKGGVCVANHTTPYDIVILSTENVFALIGQRHGGFLGILQRALARASPQIWFERSEVKDREAVARRLRQHVSDPNNPPILIFPEGTCINNTSVMQFKKGSFEVGGVIYPVAIKYDPKFGDAFWNSSKYSMMQYLYMMMSSWAIVCDVWYLPPMYQMEGESGIDFANRVKSAIARQGGLVDLMWDGQLKRMKPKKEWKEKQQEEFSKRLKVE